MPVWVGCGVQQTSNLFMNQLEVSGLAQSKEASKSAIPHQRDKKLRSSEVLLLKSVQGSLRSALGPLSFSNYSNKVVVVKHTRKSGYLPPLKVLSKCIDVNTSDPQSPKLTFLERSLSASEWLKSNNGATIALLGADTSCWLEDNQQQRNEEMESQTDSDHEQKFQAPGSTAKLDSQQLAHRWREIQGAIKWEGLLEPMDTTLRQEIIRYGEFAQANYDAFDYEPHSKYCGSSRFPKRKLLESSGLQNSGYEVTKYLYAMCHVNVPEFFRHSNVTDPWSRDSNWMGFIAVATDEQEIKRLGRRDIVISWRGTVMALEWLANICDFLTPMSPTQQKTGDGWCRRVKVESGFYSLYTSKDERTRYNRSSAAEQVKSEIRRLVELYADEELSITITGHSLGGCLATLCAYDIAKSKCNERPQKQFQELVHEKEKLSSLGPIPVSVFSFAAPRVGNDAFRDRLGELGVNVLRTVNIHDIAPKVPGLFLNEKFFAMFGKLKERVSQWLDRIPWTYSHVGVELQIDQSHSPFLKKGTDYTASHNLDLYLHLLDGYHGKSMPFKRVIERDVALVNRYCGFLRDDLCVPHSWWQQENKGLVKLEDGQWVQKDRTDEEIPSNEAHDDWQ